MDWPILIVMILFFGFMLLLMEILVVPGFGPVGIAAIVFLVIGTYLSWTKLSLAWGIGVTAISMISVISSIIFFKKSGVANRFVLNQNIEDKSSMDIQAQETSDKIDSPAISIGETGATVSDLRPSGIAEFQDKRLNVIADGIYIKRGCTSGCFLPQVAEETGWSKEEFLSYCCAHKAGLDADAWKEPETEVYLFTAGVFGADFKEIQSQ